MSAIGQVSGRAALSVRSNKSGHKLAELVAAFGADFFYDSTQDVGLNGADAASLGDQHLKWPRPRNMTAWNLAQGNAALQPLSTGAPSYRGFQSIQFVSATADQLFRNNTIFLGSNDATFFTVQKSAGTGQSIIGNVNPFSSGLDLEYVGGQLTARPFPAGTNVFATAISTTAPQAIVVRTRFNANPDASFDGGAYQFGAAPATRNVVVPGGTALTLGALSIPMDMDWLFAAGFPYELPANVGALLARTAGRKYNG